MEIIETIDNSKMMGMIRGDGNLMLLWGRILRFTEDWGELFSMSRRKIFSLILYVRIYRA